MAGGAVTGAGAGVAGGAVTGGVVVGLGRSPPIRGPGSITGSRSLALGSGVVEVVGASAGTRPISIGEVWGTVAWRAGASRACRMPGATATAPAATNTNPVVTMRPRRERILN